MSQDFLLLFFSWISFSPAPEYPVRNVSNFFFNSRRYSQVKVHHRCQRHQRQNCLRYQRHWQQSWHQYQRHWRQILPPVFFACVVDTGGVPVSTTPAANLPPVSMTPVAMGSYSVFWNVQTLKGMDHEREWKHFVISPICFHRNRMRSACNEDIKHQKNILNI